MMKLREIFTKEFIIAWIILSSGLSVVIAIAWYMAINGILITPTVGG